MKVCKMGLESIWINRADGEIRMCGWTNYNIGKLVNSTIEELWHGEKAEKFRKSMLDGSYHYCNNKKCPYLANNTLDSIMVEYELPEYPKFCSLSYEEECNYICKFCRTKKYRPQKDEKKKIEIIENEVNKFINQLDVLSANGVGELFCSPSIINTLNSIKNENIQIRLESNGSLFNEENWKKISNLGNHKLRVAITVHSFKESTYQFLSGTSLPLSNIIHNLQFIRDLRKKEIINEFEIATVICERNFRELPNFVKQCLEFEPDSIRLRFFEPYGIQDSAIEWFYDMRNSYHPYYEEFLKIMKNPIFDNPKVWKWQGEVLSNSRKHPYYIEQKKVKELTELIIMENIEQKLKNLLEKYQIHEFALYGNGYVGKAFASLLDQNNIKFKVIFDSYIEEGACFKGHIVLHPNKENINSYDMIILTSIAYEEIEETLLYLGYKGKIIRLEKLIEELDNDTYSSK